MERDLYKRRRSASLDRYKRLRELGAPTVILRNEQMILWGLRQLYYNHSQWRRALSDLPGWQANHRKFVAIHTHDGSVH